MSGSWRIVVRRLPLVVLAIVMVAGLAACATGEDGARPNADSTTPVNSPSPEPEAREAERACRTAQLKLVRGLEWPLVQVVWLVTSDPDGASAAASRLLRRSLERGETKVREPCEGLPEEMLGLRRTVLASTARPVNAARLVRVDQAVGQWTRTLNTPPPIRNTSEWLQHCRELGAHLRAGYSLGWESTPNGRRWWVQMVVDSDLSEQVGIQLDGALWVTGLRRNPYARHDGRGGQEVVWGGSSADHMVAQPFTRTTAQVGLPGPDGYLLTPADSRVYGVRPEVLVRSGGPFCSLPVRPVP